MNKSLENILNQKIISIQNSLGGCIANSQVIKTINGETYFVKQYSNSKINKTEANGLLEIQNSNSIRVPKVIFVNNEYLILEYINSKTKMNNFSEIFGRQFATMHKYNSEKFGFYEDNFIGSNPQKNTPQINNWAEFYFENRLKFQFSLAEKNGYMTAELKKYFTFLEKNIVNILEIDFEPPSLLHGDLWSGNYITDEKGNPCLIDPAVYYGNREADLAMTKLFGGFDSKFYSAYNEEFPLQKEWQFRENIYKLYHILNHLNLFGRSYYTRVINLISFYVKFQ